MAVFVLLLFLLPPTACESPVVHVHPGHDVTLRCEAGNVSISAVEWTRPDLEPQYVLFYRDGRLEIKRQHPSFTGRVELEDRELKDGDVSLTLKNVTSRDTGTYECRVKSDGSRRRKRAILKTDPIRVIHLEVRDLKDGHSTPLHVGLAAVFAYVAVLLLLQCLLSRDIKDVQTKDQNSLLLMKKETISSCVPLLFETLHHDGLFQPIMSLLHESLPHHVQ